MDIASIIDKFGLPVGLLIYFIWQNYQTQKEHKADLKEVANKAIQAIDKSTDAIDESTTAVKANSSQLSDNSRTMNRVIGVLSGRGSQSDGGGN